jgi:hypothetical protein
MRKVDEQCIANIVQRFSRLSDLDVVAQYVYKDEEKSVPILTILATTYHQLYYAIPT